MADSMLSHSMNFVFQQLTSPNAAVFGLIHGVQNQPNKLSHMLVLIRAVIISDAEQRQIQQETVRTATWLEEIPYHADQLLDEMSTESQVWSFLYSKFKETIEMEEDLYLKERIIVTGLQTSKNVTIFSDTPQSIAFEAICECTTIGSLVFFSGYGYNIQKMPQDLWLILKYVGALDLSHTRITELPNSVGNLKHLKYFDLSWSRIRSLPESISGLCNLQTLKLINCHELHTLPDNMSSLVNLRHFVRH